MSWIKVIEYDQADQKLKKIYDRVKGPNNNIDNVLKIHSLRPHSLVGHMSLYKNVLHNSNNTLPKWYLEALGVYVSHMNKCSYCFDHHFEGFRRLIEHPVSASAFKEAIHTDRLENYFSEKFLEGCRYANLLSLHHDTIQSSDIDRLRAVGFDDGEILEINQVVCYFNYVNRMVVGLGVDTEGDIIGLSPNDSDDPDNWSHK